jgi:hypothetical protein
MSNHNPMIANEQKLRWWKKWGFARVDHTFFKIYPLFIALGVPLMGYLKKGFEIPYGDIFVDAFEVKLIIAAIWFAISHLWWIIHIKEIDSQMENYGDLGVKKSDAQRASVFYLYFAVAIALLVWVAFIGLYIFTAKIRPPALWIGPSYGPVEIVLILHTLWISITTRRLIWPLITNFQQLVARVLRLEKPTSTV